MAKAIKRKFAGSLALSLCLALGACGGFPTENKSLYSARQPVVERTNFTLDVQTGGQGPREFTHAAIGEVWQGGGHLIRLVDEGDPVAVYEFGPTQVVCDGQWDLHGVGPLANRHFGHRPGVVARG